MAHFDLLTKLPNRLSFFDYLEHALARANSNKTKLCVCYIDVDNFKYINDTYGHDYGDKLLMELPERITPHLRSIDYLARIGGDEFGLILEDTNKINDVTKILDRVISSFENTFNIDGQQIKTSLSIGVAKYPQNGRDSETLLKKADMAMYLAKENGKSTFSFYNEKINVQLVKFNKIDFELERAIKEKLSGLLSTHVTYRHSSAHWC